MTPPILKLKLNLQPILRQNGKITPTDVELCNKIINAMRELDGFDHVRTIPLTLELAEFAVIFQADQGAQAMWDYIEWAKANDEAGGILETCLHDIQGRNEKFMSPRTSGYLKGDGDD